MSWSLEKEQRDARHYWRALALRTLVTVIGLGTWLAVAWAFGPVIAERVAYLWHAFT